MCSVVTTEVQGLTSEGRSSGVPASTLISAVLPALPWPTMVTVAEQSSIWLSISCSRRIARSSSAGA